MNNELVRALVMKYPRIFQNGTKSSYYAIGIECSDGWYDIIDNTCAVIQNHIDQTRRSRARDLYYNLAVQRTAAGNTQSLLNYYSHKPGGKVSAYVLEKIESVKLDPVGSLREIRSEICPQVFATQIKEKFGDLRFYYCGGDEYVAGIVAMAEQMSATTCEMCGNSGARKSSAGWIRTLCDEHSSPSK